MARKLLRQVWMSSFESIYKKMASLEQNGAPQPRPTAEKSDTTRHMSSAVAHELNNVLTIIQGYADRLLIKHRDNPALHPQLQLISEAARRASALLRETVPPQRRPSSLARNMQPVDSRSSSQVS